ncbi:MAG TPA: hypothetical protein VGO52_02905 [Hyphomonadaceae bacterium]|nr:hypothetical protein [Hyphomonadaceae bacterium]
MAEAVAQAPPQPPAALVYQPTSLAAAPGLPRTPEGRPDFQSVVWATNFFPVFEANPLAASLVVSEADGKKMIEMMAAGFLKSPDPNLKIDPEVEGLIFGGDGLPIVRGERRSRVVVLPASGKLPMTPEARKELASSGPLGSGPMDGPEQRPVGERCLTQTGQAPSVSIIAYNRLRIVQTAVHVVIHSENGDEVRIIPLAAEHRKVKDKWIGDSIARWDGDTLVVETVGFPKETRVRGFSNFIVGADSKVIERFTRLSKDELLYQYTVEDPAVYTGPWLAEYSFFAAKTGMFPSPCHEHNHSLPNILSGARVKETAKP